MSDPASTPARSSGSVLRRGFAVLARSVRDEPRIFAAATAASALYGLMTIGSSIVLGQVTEHVVLPAFRDGHAAAGSLTVAGLVIVAVGMLKAAGIVGRRLGAGIMQYRLQATYRRRVTRQYLRLPMAWHQRHPTGELLSNANADVEAAFFPIAPFPFAVGVVFMLLVTLGMLFVVDPLLAIVGCVVFPAIAAVNIAYTRRLSPLMTRALQLRGEVSGIAHESFDGALVVKTLGREAAETDRFAVRARELRDTMIRVGRVRGLFDPMMEALPSTGVLVVLLVGSWRINSGALGTGELVQVAYLFTLLAFPIRAIGWLLGELPRSAVGFDRVSRVLSAGGSPAYGTAALTADGPAALALDGVGYAYAGPLDPTGLDGRDTTADTTAGPAAGLDQAAQAGQPARPVEPARPVLTHVTFDVAAGRTVALVGPTGSGKSTLVSLLVRLIEPVGGAVLLDGVDLRALAAGQVAGAAALVPQQTFLFDDTVRENVTLGLELTDEQVWAALRTAQADRFVRALSAGLDTRVGERGTSLSGGQRQRLALARALVRRPRLLILDDATSSVDPKVEAAILAGLRDGDLPSTVFVVAYRRATIALADEVVYLEGGRVTDRGTHEELLGREPGYRRLVTAYERAEAERAEAGRVEAERLETERIEAEEAEARKASDARAEAGRDAERAEEPAA